MTKGPAHPHDPYISSEDKLPPNLILRPVEKPKRESPINTPETFDSKVSPKKSD